MGQQGGDGVAGRMENRLAVGPLDDEEGEDDLQAESPRDGAPADGAAVGGEGVGEPEKDDEAEKSRKSMQRVGSPTSVARIVWDECNGSGEGRTSSF